MKKKNLGILCASLAICGTAVFGSYAWLTATDDAITNSFNTTTDSKSIAIDLTEPAWTAQVQADAADYIPGDTFAKDPTVKNTSAKESLYAAIKVTYKLDEGQGKNVVTAGKFNEVANLDKINTGWKLIGKTTDGSEVYMYETALANNASTAALFNEVNIRNDIASTKPFDIEVKGFGTQAANASIDEVKTSLLALTGATAI